MFQAFCSRANSPHSIESSTFNHTVLMACQSPEPGNTVQKCLIMAAFQIISRGCVIHLWTTPREWATVGKLSNWHTQVRSKDPGETIQHSLTLIIGWPGGLFKLELTVTKFKVWILFGLQFETGILHNKLQYLMGQSVQSAASHNCALISCLMGHSGDPNQITRSQDMSHYHTVCTRSLDAGGDLSQINMSLE